MINKHLLVPLAVLFTVSCSSTPDLSTWTKASEDIRDSMASSQSEAFQQIDTLIGAARQAKQQEWKSGCGLDDQTSWTVNWSTAEDTWKVDQRVYRDAANQVVAGLNAMVLYAQALNELAKSAGTGKEAADGIVQSLNSIGSSIGMSVPGLGASGEILSLISEQWTKIEAQDSLADTMTLMQPHVDALSAAVRKQASLQIDVIDNLSDKGIQAIAGKYGNEKICYFQKKAKQLYAEAERPYKNYNVADDRASMSGSTLRDKEKRELETTISNQLVVSEFGLPIYRQYLSEVEI